ncbi:hypothetical protein JCM24511_01282 [Saitozyma sp. JCM 24511]|nr:hypothetical protein JCM24511_01282 [Saitozyma sp. JCM 24511]
MGRPKAKAATTEYTPSTLPSDHRLVILGIPQGSNNFLCSDPEGVERLVELGAKLRRSVLATRGDVAIVQLYPPSPETSGKGKTSRLAGEVVSMVSPGEVKRWKKDGEW